MTQSAQQMIIFTSVRNQRGTRLRIPYPNFTKALNTLTRRQWRIFVTFVPCRDIKLQIFRAMIFAVHAARNESRFSLDFCLAEVDNSDLAHGLSPRVANTGNSENRELAECLQCDR